MSPELTLYLSGWYEKSRERQLGKGTDFRLSLAEFFSLWSDSQIQKLETLLADGEAYGRMRKKNPYAWVLGWADREASKRKVMTVETAMIQTRARSQEVCGMQKGDKHSQESRARISMALKGVPKSAEHNAKNSAAMMGKNKGRVMSPEEREKRRQSALNRKKPAPASNG